MVSNITYLFIGLYHQNPIAVTLWGDVVLTEDYLSIEYSLQDDISGTRIVIFVDSIY